MHLKTLVFLAFASISISANAAEWDNLNLKTYDDLMLGLRGRGIEPSHLNWTGINSACAASFGKDELENNRCKYKFAVYQYQYRVDRADCNAISEQDLLDYQKSQININIITDKSGKVTKNVDKLTRSEKARYKNSSYRTCMRDFGWNDPYNYLAGKDDE